VVLAATLLGLGACAAERRAPVALPPAAPPTTEPPRTSRPSRTTVPDTSEPQDGVEPIPTAADPDDTAGSVPTSDDVPPTTAAAPTAWDAFDQELGNRLLGAGDHAVGVAVAVNGTIVHRADLGYRVPPDAAAAAAAAATVPSSVGPSVASTAAPTTSPVDYGGGVAVAVGADDRFRIASISKVVTAIVVLQLVEAGQLRLDDPIGDTLARIVGATTTDPRMPGITVRQLLSHTAGFPEYQPAFFRNQFGSCPEVGAWGLSRSLASDPGTSYTYSNMNYCLLGLLIEHLAGRPYEAVVADRLLAPLGIEGMRMAPTFDDDPGSVLHPSVRGRNYMEVLGAAGAWTATPSDIVTIMASLDATTPGFHPLSPAMVDVMRTIVPTAAAPPPDGRGYGLGMMVFGDGSFGHTGTIESTHAMTVDRPDGVTWAVFVSGEYPSTTGNLRSIFDDAIAAAGVALP
jgi:D-alanyl-D-alanine carboxypeptidase